MQALTHYNSLTAEQQEQLINSFIAATFYPYQIEYYTKLLKEDLRDTAAGIYGEDELPTLNEFKAYIAETVNL